LRRTSSTTLTLLNLNKQQRKWIDLTSVSFTVIDWLNRMIPEGKNKFSLRVAALNLMPIFPAPKIILKAQGGGKVAVISYSFYLLIC
jgi:hypothetical protein